MTRFGLPILKLTDALTPADLVRLAQHAEEQYFRFGSKVGDPLQMYLCDVFTVTCNIAGIAGLNIPCGFSSGGLPIGLQLLGQTFSEPKLLRIGRQYELAHGWSRKKPMISAG